VKPRRAAVPYAKALFALAKERNQTELIGRELDDAATTFASDAELRDFFARPWIRWTRTLGGCARACAPPSRSPTTSGGRCP